jgi:uncharacterized membrane protein
MVWLCIGVLLFMLVHFVPSLAPGFKESMVRRIGAQPYRGIFSLFLVSAIVLMVIGWRSTTPALVYLPPSWGTPLTSVLMLISVMLFGAAQQPGMAVWSVGHLISNGDSRSLILFGGLGLWALIEMILLNKREGAWVRPYGPALSVEVRGIVISAVFFFVLVYLHPYFAGVSPIPR